MKTLFFIFIYLSLLYSDQNVSTALGAPKEIKNQLKTFKQKDGSSFRGKTRGEAYFNYIELENGYTALYNKETEQFEYALLKNGTLHPSGIPVQREKVPNNIPKIPQKTLKQLEEDAYKKHF